MPDRTPLLDSRLFPAFLAVAELKSFTQAAEAAHMTQSGVSQHIAKLEGQIGHELINRKTGELTEAGVSFRDYLKKRIDSENEFLDKISAEHDQVSGLVSYAMPPSCLLSDHFVNILERRRLAPDLRLKIVTGSSSEILDLVLREHVDFAFIAGTHENAAVTFDPFCEEECVLVSADPTLAKSSDPEKLFSTPVVAFPGGDVYYDMWLKHTIPSCRRDHRSLTQAASINSIHGAILMVVSGLGCGVFPRHCVQTHIAAGVLFEHSNISGPLLHRIYVAQIAGYQAPRRVRVVLKWFTELLKEAPKNNPISEIRPRLEPGMLTKNPPRNRRAR